MEPTNYDESMNRQPQSTNPRITDEMKNSDFHRLFVEELKDIYGAELALAKALPKLQQASTSAELASAFERHTRETEMHAQTLESIFELIDETASGKKCEAMAGLLDEADTIIADTERDSFTRDAALILAAQKAEHYEIATYGTLRVFANHMNHTEVARLLEQILENEKRTDAALTGIAESFINEEAVTE